jgi:hypothetical protein
MWGILNSDLDISADSIEGSVARLASDSHLANTVIIPSSTGPAYLGNFIDKSFKGLADIPAMSASHAGKYFRINTGETAFELSTTTTSSFGTSGYTVFHNGLILQWGFVAKTSESDHTVTLFPTTFPTACLNVSLTAKVTNASTSSDWNALVLDFDKTGVLIEVCISTSTYISGVSYLAIGY